MKMKGALFFFWEIIKIVLIALIIVVPIRYFVFQPFFVRGQSMEPNFQNGQYILTNKVEYKLRSPNRGDVVIFKSPRNKDVDYIKRIIGKPGDRVMLKEGTFYVNGTKVEESYLASGTYISQGSFLREGSEIIVPKGQYFLVGDNRGHSSDSREFGTIPLEDFIGRAFLRYWPFSQAGLIQQPTYVLP